MDIIPYLATIGLLGGMNVFLLIVHQLERKKSIEREMKLIKAVLADNVQELQVAEESPEETRKRMTIENDLALKAEKLRQSKDENSDFDRIPIL